MSSNNDILKFRKYVDIFNALKAKAIKSKSQASSKDGDEDLSGVDALLADLNNNRPDITNTETDSDIVHDRENLKNPSSTNTNYDFSRSNIRMRVGSNIKQLIRDEKHEDLIVALEQSLDFTKRYDTIAHLKEEWNIDEFVNMKTRYEKGEATAKEAYIMQICKENFILFGQKKGADRKIIGIGMGYASFVASEFEYEEKFLIGREIINTLLDVNSFDFLDNSSNSAKYNLSQILNYMETHQISDLHIKMHDEINYSFTGRKHTKIVKIGNRFYDAKTTEDLIHRLLIESNREANDNANETRALLPKILDDGSKRNFRFHLIDSTYENVKGNSISMRRLPKESELKDIIGLGYLYLAYKMIIATISKNKEGLIIISGPTNSGKTTLLNAILVFVRDELNRRIHRIENPAEVSLSGIITVDLMQTKDSVNPLTMREAISHVLSHDPDVTLVGEARLDSEKSGAFELAEKGHLSMVTVHAGDNERAIKGFLKVDDIAKEDFNGLLKMSLNQELVEKICPHCNGDKTVVFSKEKKPCPDCGGSGASTVLPVYDLIIYFNVRPDDDITDTEKLLREGKAFRISKKEVLNDYLEKGWIKNLNETSLFNKDINEYIHDTQSN